MSGGKAAGVSIATEYAIKTDIEQVQTSKKSFTFR
jgi:hypothetical protein